MSETKVPAIPSLQGITDPALRTILSAIKEVLEVRDGRRGNELDQFVKLRDLTEAKIATVKRRGAGGNNSLLDPEGVKDYASPPALTNLAVTGGYQQMFLEWDYLGPFNYASFSHVEIWRSATDVLGEAVILGETTASLYSDPCGSSLTFYYWVRAVSTSNVMGPFNAVHGTVGSTSLDVTYLLDKLTGSITESQLFTSLNDRIDLIDAPATNLNSVNARVAALRSDTEDSVAQVNTRVDVLESYDQDLITAINQIIVVDQGQASELYLEQTARIAADNAQAAQIESISALVATNAANITNEQTARATADTALTNSLNTALSRVGAAEATITSNYNTLAGVDTAQAAAINTLSSTVNGNTASIQTQATTLNGLSAQYTVKVDVNGYVSGYGLSSTLNNATPYSTFYVRADSFAVGSPGQTGVTPFVVQTSPQVVNGETVPVGVYMDGAYIKNGTITNAKIGNAAIDSAKIADASIVTAKIGDAQITGAKIANATIDTAQIKTAAITSAVIADAAITNAKIADAAITNAKIGNAAITLAKIDTASITSLSALSATIGLFKSAPSGARLEIRDDVIFVFDSGGALRVQLGNLSATP